MTNKRAATKYKKIFAEFCRLSYLFSIKTTAKDPLYETSAVGNYPLITVGFSFLPEVELIS
jgi:hypothetical protein